MSETPPPPDPARARARRPALVAVVVLLVTGVAALAAVVAAVLVVVSHPKQIPPVAAERGMLQVEMNKTSDDKLDPAKPLRCFVAGQFVGQATLADCAAKNGVSAQNLDVGLDPSGQVAAQGGAAEPLAPLPEATVASADGDVTRRTPSVTQDDADADAPPPQGAGLCLRFSNGGWRSAGAGSGSLRACVEELYQDRCVRPGDALYGRFGQQTLRLVPGRVEISDDNRRFRPFVAQDPDACSLEE